ncbi:MAG: NAD+ synthase [Acidobacteriota bacterium]
MRLNQDLLKKFLVKFIREELTKFGFDKGILGLSGGVDSTVAAFLTSEALGRENTIALIMPYKESEKSSVKDAVMLAESKGIRYKIIEITPMIDVYFRDNFIENRIIKGNKMARERMSILYDYSAREKALVIGTSNKTELLLGYGTLWGDMVSAVNPLGDLYKTQVLELAEYLKIPEKILKKIPSADLWVGQTDEDELGMSYQEMDKILYLLVDERKSAEEIKNSGFSEEKIFYILEKIRDTQFKRRLPVIPKLSSRTLSLDFLYFRDWGR